MEQIILYHILKKKPCFTDYSHTTYQYVLLLFLTVGTTESTYKRVCYYTNWAQYRQPPYQFKPGNIDLTLCTNIIYAFAEISGDAIKPYEWNDESTKWSTGNMYVCALIKRK